MDQQVDAQALYVLAYLEAARFVYLLKKEGYSENSRTVLETTLNVQIQYEKVLSNYNKVPWPKIYSPSLKALGSFLKITQFHLQKFDLEYEEALLSVAEGIELFRQISRLMSNNSCYPYDLYQPADKFALQRDRNNPKKGRHGLKRYRKIKTRRGRSYSTSHHQRVKL